MNVFRSSVVSSLAACGLVSALWLTAPSVASAESWYGRPNTITCISTAVFIDAPTNVPTTGGVVWEADVYLWNPATATWELGYSQQLSNVADDVGITAGPWADEQQNPVYVVTVGVTPSSSDPAYLAVYNWFYSTDTGQWIEGFWSTDTLSGEMFCSTGA